MSVRWSKAKFVVPLSRQSIDSLQTFSGKSDSDLCHFGKPSAPHRPDESSAPCYRVVQWRCLCSRIHEYKSCIRRRAPLLYAVQKAAIICQDCKWSILVPGDWAMTILGLSMDCSSSTTISNTSHLPGREEQWHRPWDQRVLPAVSIAGSLWSWPRSLCGCRGPSSPRTRTEHPSQKWRSWRWKVAYLRMLARVRPGIGSFAQVRPCIDCRAWVWTRWTCTPKKGSSQLEGWAGSSLHLWECIDPLSSRW